ncbi:hypothetical protein LG274_02585 [Micrococcus antarcticus]|uniref:hypothetical protein n=1 Tax=Micrococcus antarcticus TaxID=86171 RepID=UPI00384FD283
MATNDQIINRQRVRELGEVFTAEREVRAMLDLVPEMFPAADRPLDVRRTFLEPACGRGAFLVEILARKLQHLDGAVQNPWHLEAYALDALASIYGVDIDQENVAASRLALLRVFAQWLGARVSGVDESVWDAALVMTRENIKLGNFLGDMDWIVWTTWTRVGVMRYLRSWSTAGGELLEADAEPVWRHQLGGPMTTAADAYAAEFTEWEIEDMHGVDPEAEAYWAEPAV